jgi:hypothetical protein
MNDALIYGFHMTSRGVAMAEVHPLGSQAPPTWQPGPANQNEFFPHYRQKYSSAPPSDNPAGEEAGCGGPGLAW